MLFSATTTLLTGREGGGDGNGGNGANGVGRADAGKYLLYIIGQSLMQLRQYVCLH
jgi:hypothetical protein